VSGLPGKSSPLSDTPNYLCLAVLLNLVCFIFSNIVVEFNSYDAGPGRLKSGLGIRSNFVDSRMG